MHWRRKWQPTPAFLPGESQGRGSLVGCRPWGRTESDTTEVTQQQQQQHTSPRPSLVAQTIQNLPEMQDTWVQSLGWEDLLKKEMATHSGVLAWRIPWIEESGGLQSLRSGKVGHDRMTDTLHTSPAFEINLRKCTELASFSKSFFYSW